MKGTEKQVAWARSIVEEAKKTIELNIERLQDSLKVNPGLAVYEEELQDWQNCKFWYGRQMQEAEKRDLPASWYIDNRGRIGADAIIKKVNEAGLIRQARETN